MPTNESSDSKFFSMPISRVKTPSREELLQLGQEIAADPTCAGMERQGRPLTNIEMKAILVEAAERKAAERIGRTLIDHVLAESQVQHALLGY